MKTCTHCNTSFNLSLPNSTVDMCTQCGKATIDKKKVTAWYLNPTAITIDPNTVYTITHNNTTYDVLGGINGTYSETRLAFLYLSQSIENSNTIVYYDCDWYIAKPITFDNSDVDFLKRKEISDVYRIYNKDAMLVAKDDWKARKYFGASIISSIHEDTKYYEWVNDKIQIIYGVIDDTVVDAYELIQIEVTEHHLPENFLWQEREIVCEQCRAEINVPYYPLMASCICSGCNTGYSLTSKGFSKKEKQIKIHNYIPIDTFFEIDNNSYKTVGYLEKKDSYGYMWKEFTLFGEKAGFAYLSEYNGNFNFLRRKKKVAVMDMQRTLKTERLFENSHEYYQLFNNYNYSIRGGGGVFQGNVLNDGNPASVEYIAPPALRSYEHVLNESVDVYDGRHISRADLLAATTSIINLPHKTGVGATQPVVNDHQYRLVALFITLAIFILTFMATSNYKKNASVFSETIDLKDSSFNRNGFISETFDLENTYNNLHVKMQADVLNTWIEPSVEIINVETGKSQVYEKGIEYYTGVEDGYRWSEGSTKESLLMESLTKGKYQMAIKTVTNDTMIQNLSIAVEKNKVMTRNAWLPMLLVFILFLINYLIANAADRNRWSESPYNPYGNE